MSLLSRLFRKAPSPLPPSPATAPAPTDRAAPRPGPNDRALTVAAEQRALQTALDAQDLLAVARLAVAGRSTQVRQAAARAIEDPELLRHLIREVRGGKDNEVYKILTGRRDAQIAQVRQREQLQAEIAAASRALEQHSRDRHDISYGPLLAQFETRWEAVAAEADAALRDQVQQWIAQAQQVIADHRREFAAQALREQAAIEAAAEAARLQQAQAQETAALAAKEARLVDAQRQALAQQREAEQHGVRQIAESIRKARAALSEGGTARAAGLRRTIEQQRAAAPPLPANLASQLQQLDQQLDELKDWKNFSVTPKRAELIEAMQALIGAALEPLALAEKIKHLQDQWRTLAKGATDGLDAEGQRFQAVTQQAYQPCREYFAAQALVRQENLQRRAAVLARLTAFEAAQAGQPPDWGATANALRDAKLEWRRHTPVDRDAAQPQQEQFVALTARLKSGLDAEHAGNREQKEALIQRAEALLASEDNRKAIDAIKELQRTWRTVGPVPRALDQRLWEQFRQHCDAVFQKREQASAAYAAGLESNRAQAVALSEHVEQIAALDGAALLQGAGSLEALQKSFDALGELPPADARALRSRFDRGMERCKEALAHEYAREAEQVWNDLFDAANQVRAYRLAVARSADATERDRLRTAAEAAIASNPRWPRTGLEALQHSIAVASAADDLAANEAALRRLCISAEILIDQPTPSEDQALRREMQLRRLVQGMGQGLKGDSTSLDSLALEWVQTGPVDDAVYEPLQRRFRACRELSRAQRERRPGPAPRRGP